MSTAATLALMFLAFAPAATPPEAEVKACEQQAKAAAGAPVVSPRSQPNASQPTDDTTQQARSDAPAPTRRPTPGTTQQDVEARNTPLMPDADGHDAYRSAYQACLRARGY